MNKEEVKFDHFKNIEELIQHLEMWYAEDDYYAYDRYFHLRDARIMGMFIYELQQENNQLKEELKATKEVAEEHLKKEIQYKEVIEEVREYIKEHLTDNGRFLMLNEWQVPELLQILDKGERDESTNHRN